MKRKLNEKGIMAISIVAFMLLIILITIVVYFCKLGSVKKESVIKNFEIEEGDTLISIANKLEQEKLIKSSLAYKIYIKTHKSSTIKMGIYELNQNMSVKEIVETLSGNNYKEDALNITFKEGININEIANIIDEKTNNTRIFEPGKAPKAAKEVKLDYRVLDTRDYKGKKVSLIDINLHTGRSHQIRTQMQYIKHPLLGDARYGTGIYKGDIALMSYLIGFKHPITGEYQEYKIESLDSLPWSIFS